MLNVSVVDAAGAVCSGTDFHFVTNVTQAVGQDVTCGLALRLRRYWLAGELVETKYSDKAVTGNEHRHRSAICCTLTILFQLLTSVGRWS